MVISSVTSRNGLKTLTFVTFVWNPHLFKKMNWYFVNYVTGLCIRAATEATLWIKCLKVNLLFCCFLSWTPFNRELFSGRWFCIRCLTIVGYAKEKK